MHHRLAYFIVVLSIHSACGLYFLMGETERRCFIQETPDDTTVTVNYIAEVRDPQHTNGFIPLSAGIGMHWEVRDSDKKVVLSRTYNSEGRFSFTSHWPGDHSLCLKSNISASFKGSLLRVHLDFRVDYGGVTQRKKLDQIQLQILQLQNQADQIFKHQNYQRFLEVRFRRTNENIYSRMVWWSILQAIIVVFVFAHMTHNLNKFSLLYKAFCKVLSEKTLTGFKTAEAFNALMELIGPEGQGVSNKAISQWIAQFLDPESTNESDQININETLLNRVNEFVEKFLSKKLQTTERDPQCYASNLNLMNLLAGTQRNRSAHLTGNTFLLVCKANDSESNEDSAKS